MRPFPLAAVALAAVTLALFPAACLATAADGSPGGGASSFTISDRRITESSGLAASRRHPGLYWTHNDSGDGPYVYGVDAATGRTVARLTLTGIGTPRDVEAISLGPDGRLYVGDIGDNRNGRWDQVWIYRFPEPARLGDQSVKATTFTVRYEDGPRDAESLMVHPVTGRVYIASKNQSGGGLYEGPERLQTGATNVFRRIAPVPWVTDGAFSPDGTRVTLRGYLMARTYPWRDGRPVGEGARVEAPWQGQAESVTYSADGSMLLFGSEGKDSQVMALPATPSGSLGVALPNPGAGGPTLSDGHAPVAHGGGNFTLSALVLSSVAAAVIGLRRLTRRGGSSRR
ncbi:WD40 repeat domain-containing protein [Streptomyces avidinii]|uniref:WD40 repeat domain-containing protein n=1 Tax=Streptomyces TaxID=1883 RepID=UPI000F3A9767|nr:WD40 repeat domain-containing protein [Streptomyces sp. ADI95-16]AYV26409.1 hypothetical protein EES41_06705 [Streptomyces sp. ADI95-16]